MAHTEIDEVRTSLGNDIKSVRGEVQTLSREFRNSSDRILGVLSDIKTNTTVTHTEVDHNKKNLKKLSLDWEKMKSDIHDLGHAVAQSDTTSDSSDSGVHQ